MTNQKRRQFLCVATTAVASLHCRNSFARTLKPEFNLRTSDVKQGLRNGLKFREQDLEVLNLLSNYSDRQVMIGGGVMTFAAEQPTEWIHLIVRLDRIEAFAETVSLPEMPWGGAYASHGNTLSFEYKGQRYYIENLMEKEFRERMQGLTQPGSEVNGFRLEFAHDAVVYEVQARRHGDPFGAISGGTNIELKRIAPAKGISSALRLMTEEKSVGIEPSRTEKRKAEQTISGKTVSGQSPKERTADLLAGLSRTAEFLDEYEIRNLVDSNIVNATVTPELGGEGREITTSFNRITRQVDSKVNDGTIWHLAIQRVEKTAEPEIEKTQTFTRSRLGGYNDFFARRDMSAAAKETASEKGIYKNREKSDAVEEMQDAVRRARSAKRAPEEFQVAEQNTFVVFDQNSDEPTVVDYIPDPENIPAVLPNPADEVAEVQTQPKPRGRKDKLKKIATEVAEDAKDLGRKVWKKLLEYEKMQRGN